MKTFKQKEYSSSQEVIEKLTSALEKEREYGYEVSEKVPKDTISIDTKLSGLTLYIPQDFEFTQYSIDDFIREMLPYAYTNTKYESGLYKMSVHGKLTQTQYYKLVKHIIRETEFCVILEG